MSLPCPRLSDGNVMNAPSNVRQFVHSIKQSIICSHNTAVPSTRLVRPLKKHRRHSETNLKRRSTDKVRTSAIESPTVFSHQRTMKRTGRLRDLGTQSMATAVAQNRRVTRLTGCFVPRHLNSPRLAPSSLSSPSPSRSCLFTFALFFAGGGESESDEGTLLRATAIGA